jgi:hypothetical protein
VTKGFVSTPREYHSDVLGDDVLPAVQLVLGLLQTTTSTLVLSFLLINRAPLVHRKLESRSRERLFAKVGAARTSDDDNDIADGGGGGDGDGGGGGGGGGGIDDEEEEAAANRNEKPQNQPPARAGDEASSASDLAQPWGRLKISIVNILLIAMLIFCRWNMSDMSGFVVWFSIIAGGLLLLRLSQGLRQDIGVPMPPTGPPGSLEHTTYQWKLVYAATYDTFCQADTTFYLLYVVAAVGGVLGQVSKHPHAHIGAATIRASVRACRGSHRCGTMCVGLAEHIPSDGCHHDESNFAQRDPRCNEAH